MATARRALPGQLFGEETLPGYEPDQFYPVHIGDTLGLCYAVIGKLTLEGQEQCRHLEHCLPSRSNLLGLELKGRLDSRHRTCYREAIISSTVAMKKEITTIEFIWA